MGGQGKGRNMERDDYTKGLLKGHMETNHSRSFLKYKKEFKWSYYTMGWGRECECHN